MSELPAAVEVERQVLGAALIDDVACATTVQMLRTPMFYDSQHRNIFDAITAVFQAGTSVDLVTVVNAAEDTDVAYLNECTTATAAASNTEHHCRIIQEKWMLRHMHRIFQRGASLTRNGEEDPIELLEKAQKGLSELIVLNSVQTHIREAVTEAVQQVEDWYEGKRTDRMPSGIYGLDEVTGGLPIGEATWINGHTGSGKTSIITQMCRAVGMIQARKNDPDALVLFSAEMSRKQITLRMAQNKHRISTSKLRTRRVDDEDFSAFLGTLNDLRELPIHIVDTAAPTLEEMRAHLMRIKAQTGICLVYVDYDEKIQSGAETDEVRMANIARGLKDLAKTYRVPLVTLGQYNRKYDRYGSADKYGVPSDDWMRASGKKQQEAYMILHWHWPGYWIEKGDANPDEVDQYDPNDPNRGWLVCTKNRDGSTGKVPLRFHPKHTYFEDLNRPKEQASPF